MNEQGTIGPELLVELRGDDGAPLRAQLEAGLRGAWKVLLAVSLAGQDVDKLRARLE